jgi:hypothetical protein
VRVALQYPELLRTVVFGEGVLEPVSPEGKAAVAAAQKDNEKFRQAVEAGDLRLAAMLQCDGALGEHGAFEKLPPEPHWSKKRSPRAIETALDAFLRSFSTTSQLFFDVTAYTVL